MATKGVQNPLQAEEAKAKSKAKKSSEEESCQKTSLEEACSDQTIFKETGAKDWSEVVLNRIKFIVSKLFDKIEIQ